MEQKTKLGHLIHSATNNHQQFIRAQFEETPFIRYNQNKWNEYSCYQQLNVKHLVSFWHTYNLHLVQIIGLLPGDTLLRKCDTGGVEPVTLAWLINDYVSTPGTSFEANSIL